MKALFVAVVALGCSGEAIDRLNDAPELFEEVTGPECVMEGHYNVRYLPQPGCGEPNEFPARVDRREVKCDTPDQHCEPGVPSERCDFTRKIGGACEARVIWEIDLDP